MEFREALEVAKSNPGAIVTRGADGSFVVLGSNGQPLVGASSPTTNDAASIQSENERLRQRISDLYAQIDDLRRQHHEEIIGLESKNHHLQTTNSEIGKRSRLLESEMEALNKKLRKVSPVEWERIRTIEEKEQAEYHQELLKVRKTIKCSCSGEVENCPRCYGSGSYVVDGYGHSV